MLAEDSTRYVCACARVGSQCFGPLDPNNRSITCPMKGSFSFWRCWQFSCLYILVITSLWVLWSAREIHNVCTIYPEFKGFFFFLFLSLRSLLHNTLLICISSLIYIDILTIVPLIIKPNCQIFVPVDLVDENYKVVTKLSPLFHTFILIFHFSIFMSGRTFPQFYRIIFIFEKVFVQVKCEFQRKFSSGYELHNYFIIIIGLLIAICFGSTV